MVVLQGDGVVSPARGELYFTGGDAFMPPPDLSHVTRMHNVGLAMVQVPWAVVGRLAEEATGVPAADLRFESMPPVSAARQAAWARTAGFDLPRTGQFRYHRGQPVDGPGDDPAGSRRPAGDIPQHHDDRRLHRGPGWMPPAAVRRAAAFIDAHADQPITLADIAAAEGTTGRAVQHAFRRYYGITPTWYLRRVRLARAHQQLRAADPASGVTVAAVARQCG